MLTCRPKDWYRLDIVSRACCIESGLWAKMAQSSAFWSSQIWRVSVFVWAWSWWILRRLPSRRIPHGHRLHVPWHGRRGRWWQRGGLLKSPGAKTQPWFTPNVLPRKSLTTALLWALWLASRHAAACRMLRNFGRFPESGEVFPEQRTVSKALLRSMKAA